MAHNSAFDWTAGSHPLLPVNADDGPTLRVVPLGRMSGGLIEREARPINPDRTDANAPLIRPIMLYFNRKPAIADL